MSRADNIREPNNPRIPHHTPDMFSSTHDGFTYIHSDKNLHDSIQAGIHEPYSSELPIVDAFLAQFPHRCHGYVNIGARIGTTLLPYARRFQRCVAYEPDTDNYAFLTCNIATNGVAKTCTARNVGCSDCASAGIIQLDDDAVVGASQVDFIEVGADGSGLQALLGARTTILRCKPLIAIHATHQATSLALLTTLGAVTFGRSSAGVTFMYFPERVIRVFWTDATPISARRTYTLQALRTVTDAHVELYTTDTIPYLELPGTPFHAAYAYLSAVHRADFLRTYCMHHYGGGYSDLKVPTGSWKTAFDVLDQDPETWIVGYPEIEGGVGYAPCADKWRSFVGNCAYVCRAGSPLTQTWYDAMIQLLDTKLGQLAVNPATHPRSSTESQPGYPIQWSEMLGRIFHRVLEPYLAHAKAVLPLPIFKDYQ